MFKIEETALVVVDVQGKLARSMYEQDLLFENLEKVIKGAQILDLPIIWLEQYPQGLGETISEVAELFEDSQPIAKTSFSACGNQEFKQRLESLGSQNLLVVGIETHICVYQTVRDLLDLDYGVQVLSDAVSSRKLSDKKVGLARMGDLGAELSSTEMALFELLEVGVGEQFKQILELVK
ncbi:hydrolase [Fuchsiella alkaliacetigena]|uniref:hydrolase n=1 Tax=Fuchsiella alkaliacetigena TaxID=957042 RepID=UPI00200A5E85|nr:hydrolase [Fuchsiella alkaliacetigena]MCK8825809.1 hydrolase [Fuchsiella alkaliacetigena]